MLNDRPGVFVAQSGAALWIAMLICLWLLLLGLNFLTDDRLQYLLLQHEDAYYVAFHAAEAGLYWGYHKLPQLGAWMRVQHATLGISPRIFIAKQTLGVSPGTLRDGVSKGEQVNAPLGRRRANLLRAGEIKSGNKNTPVVSPGIFIYYKTRFLGLDNCQRKRFYIDSLASYASASVHLAVTYIARQPSLVETSFFKRGTATQLPAMLPQKCQPLAWRWRWVYVS